MFTSIWHLMLATLISSSSVTAAERIRFAPTVSSEQAPKKQARNSKTYKESTTSYFKTSYFEIIKNFEKNIVKFVKKVVNVTVEVLQDVIDLLIKILHRIKGVLPATLT